MKGGKGNNLRGPKWGPLMTSVPPDSSNFSQDIHRGGGGHSFLSRANAAPPPPPPPHLNPAWGNLHSPRQRGGQGAAGVHQQQWGSPSPSPPGTMSPRGHHTHQHQQRRGFRTPPSVQGGHNAPPQMSPRGHLHGGPVWRPTVPIQNSSGFPLNEMMMSSPEVLSFPQSPWGLEGIVRPPVGHFDIIGLPPGDDTLSFLERLATHAHNDLLAGKQSVSSGKVALATLSALGAPAFEAVGIMPQDIPSLRKLATLEGRINAYIHSYVAGRKIATLHDLRIDLAREEGVKDFGDLGLGPLLCHELVSHYFSPPAGVEVYKITTVEVIKQLAYWVGHHPKEKLQVEGFLSFVANRLSLPSPEHLCVRVQSLGTFVGHIRRSKKAEMEQIGLWEHRVKEEVAKTKKQSVMERVNLFLFAEREKEASLRKRKRFSSESSPDSDDDTGDEDPVDGIPKRVLQSSAPRRKVKLKDESTVAVPVAVTSCPYPSAAEERARVKKLELQHFVANSEKDDFYLSRPELQDFVAILKDACQNHSVHEVLMRMIEMSRKFKGTKKRSGKSKIFKAYPAIGLLNVAILSIKAGFWDSTYQNFLDAVDLTDRPLKEKIQSVQIAAPIDVASSKQSTVCQASNSPGPQEIVAAVSEHYEKHLRPQIVDACENQYKAWWSFLHWVQECEDWITGKYSVKSFASLGFGKFSHFLEQYIELLPSWVVPNLVEKTRSRTPVAKVPQKRLFSFLEQALRTAPESGSSVEDHISGLLHRQFKVSSIEELGASSVESLLEASKEGASSIAPIDHVLFLEPLVISGTTKGNDSAGRFKANSPQVQAEGSDVTHETRVGVLGCKTSDDAAKCLLKAPFLVDLAQWSQWHSVFAPTLGPLLDWFEREGSKWGLHAIVTGDGALLRIDGNATAEGFLLATVEGRGDQMAAVLMSLIALYGGTANTPTALLKSQASKGLDILLGSSAGEWTSQAAPSCASPMQTKRKFTEELGGQAVKLIHSFRDVKPETAAGFAASGQSRVKAVGDGELRDSVGGRIGDQSSVTSRCIMECLSCVIPEFRTFTAEILLPALSPLIAGAPALLMSTCFDLQQKSILHGLGFCLGIPEWVSDYTTSAFGPTQLSPSDTSGPEDMEVDRSTHVQLEREVSDEFVTCNGSSPMVNSVKGEIRNGNQDAETLSNNLPSILETGSLQRSPHGRLSSGSNSTGQTNGKGSKTDIKTSKDMLLERVSIDVEATKVIEDIRQHEFGLGQDIQGEGFDLLARQHARMGRALHRLSSDLYSQDSHFVLELVQNADDNAYNPGVEAALLFLIQEGRIVVLNNETGFTAANVRALCDVGNSTKAGMNTGYIGHKGIGFKSVFRVTDAPEIHSNGFHVKFDISEGDLGFILPTSIPPPLVGDSSAEITALMSESEMPKSVIGCWNTRINLPIKAFLQKGTGLSVLASKFSDLHPSLLLFLHHLRRIAVRNDLTGSTVVMHREDKGEDLIKVVHGTGTATWMVVRQQLNAKVHRPGVTETQIALAFQLNEVSMGNYEACSEQQQVFAFLPLRSYGLRFILQGDFKVPSSREEVDCDSDWNQWLRSEIPNVFLKSASTFQKTLAGGSLNPGKAVSSFMSFVPMEGEVLGFFSPLPRMILSSLRGSACLPVEGGGWAMPCVLLRGWTDSTRQLLPDVFLHEHLGLRYLAKDVVITDVLALKLGVQQFEAGTLVAVMKSVCQKKGALTSLGIEWVQAWLLALHDCLASDQKSHHPGLYPDEKYTSFRLQLQSLPYIPLSNGMFTSLSDGPVWFAGELLDNGLGLNSVLSEFKLLSSELRTIHPSLVSRNNECGISEGASLESSSSYRNVELLEKNPMEKVVAILQRLGVSKLSAHELLKSHVLPAMGKDDCLSKDQHLVVEYLGFVISHRESNCVTCSSSSGELNVIAELQKCAVILTSKGLIRAGQEPIHFSSAMGNNTPDMRMILEGTEIPWIEVSPLYLQLQAKGCELTHLRNFFKELGVTDFVKVVYRERRLLDKNASEWKNCLWEEEGEASEKGWIVQDWHSPELAQILMNISTDGDSSRMEEEQRCSSRLRERCAGMLAALDHNWDDYYHKFCDASYSPLAVKVMAPHKATVSSFLLLLQQSSWVRSRMDGKLRVPTDLFRPCEAVESVLGRQAPYVDTPIQSTAFMEALGFRTQVSVNDALQLLRYWSQERRFFEASIEEMTRLYSFLWEKLPSYKEEVVRVFTSGESIFVPLHWSKNAQEVQLGRFYSVKNVCWSDPTNLLDLVSLNQKTRLHVPAAALGDIYPSLQEFFVNVCTVQETPSFDEYLEVLKNITAEQPPSATLSQVMGVLNLWSSEISRGNVEPSEITRWKGRLEEAESRIFATNQDKWVSLNDREGLVCICDDKKLGEEFKEFLGQIHFILMAPDDLRETSKQGSSPKPEKWDLQPLVQALGIRKLSEVVERDVVKYGLHDGGKIEVLVDWVLPYAQRYMKHHHIDRYRYLQGLGVMEALGRLQFVAVDRLYFQYSVRNRGIRSKRKTPCTCILEGNTLHVVENFVQDYCNIYAELSRLLFGGKPNLPIANFLHLITLMASSGSSKSEVESFIQNVQGIRPGMEGEEFWTLGTRLNNGHPATHLVGWPPKTWEASVDGERVTELNGGPSGVNMPENNQNRVAPLHSRHIAEYPTTKGDTFGDGPSTSIMEKRAGRGLPNGPIKDLSSPHRPSYPLPIQGNGNIHAGNSSQSQEVQNLSPSRLGTISEAHNQSMDVQEVMIDGSDSAMENSAQNRALTNFQGRDSLATHPVNEQQRETGRSGEAIVYQHLSSHYGAAQVRWLNQEAESGAAYDIVVIKDSGKKEFVEVKATRSAGKDWFEISPKEWDFARSHPESFTIIRVCLGTTSQQVRLLRLPNPVKLAQDHVLQLALLLPAVQDNTPQ